MAGISLQEERARRAERAFLTLPERYLGAPRGFAATYAIRLTDLGRSWEARLDAERCRVVTPARGKADVTIDTDTATWLALREGRLSGLDAFQQRRLDARGDVDLAIGFEGMFRLPGGRPPLLRVHRVGTDLGEISAITAGSGPEHVVCLHGLGATKASFFSTIAALSRERTVHALDLPGFGTSDKPARAPYDAAWFASGILRYLDRMGIDQAHLIGNSMGGRIALEVGLTAPGRVRSLGLLAPALAFLHRRGLVPLVRLLRPELAVLPHRLAEGRVRDHVLAMFADPERLDPAAAELATAQFLETYGSRAARVAFYSAARNIYLDPPHGHDGLWTRLASLRPPATFIWGTEDRLVPAGFSGHVSRALPRAQQVVIDDCGHVPQVEHPERTNALLAARIEAGGERDGAEASRRRLLRGVGRPRMPLAARR